MQLHMSCPKEAQEAQEEAQEVQEIKVQMLKTQPWLKVQMETQTWKMWMQTWKQTSR
jgi:hypothetical protein